MKKFISLFLVFSILTLSMPLTSKERRGADLIIQRSDGTQVRGELIAVKANSLLLLYRESGADLSIDIKDIRMINIMKKRTWKNAKKGILIADGIWVVGLGLGALTWGIDTSTESILQLLSGLLVWSGIGALIGVLTGSPEEIGETILFEGKTDLEIQDILERLRKIARIRNSQ